MFNSSWVTLHYIIAPPSETWALKGTMKKGRERAKRHRELFTGSIDMS